MERNESALYDPICLIITSGQPHLAMKINIRELCTKTGSLSKIIDTLVAIIYKVLRLKIKPVPHIKFLNIFISKVLNSKELSLKLNRPVLRKEKMNLIVDFLQKNENDLSTGQFVSFLERYVAMATEEYKNAPGIFHIAEDYVYALLLLCEKYIKLQFTWKCAPLLEITISIMNEFHEDSQEVNEGKFEIWSKSADLYSSLHRYQQSIDCYARALEYSLSKADFDAEDFFYRMIEAYKSLGLEDWPFIKVLIDKYWPDKPKDPDSFISKVQFSCIKTDQIENSMEYLIIKDELEKKLYYATSKYPQGMGFCFNYWYEKSRILKNDYNINWCSPAELNPRVMFD